MANQIIAALTEAGFRPVRQRGTHILLRHEDWRVVTVPQHGSHDIRRGLLRKILRDSELSVEEFEKLI